MSSNLKSRSTAGSGRASSATASKTPSPSRIMPKNKSQQRHYSNKNSSSTSAATIMGTIMVILVFVLVLIHFSSNDWKDNKRAPSLVAVESTPTKGGNIRRTNPVENIASSRSSETQQQRSESSQSDHDNNEASPPDTTTSTTSLQPIDKFRKDFQTRYGDNSLEWLDKAMEELGSVDITARRILTKKSLNRPLVLSFAGYSVTVGRGNHFEESFPFVLERLLKPLLQEVLQVDLVVRNAAIGGIPSFPYAFCLEHFLGADTDVMSWDYSMNEGNGAEALESYLRLSRQNLPLQPMLIVLDKNAGRTKLLKQYASQGLLSDGLVLRRAETFLPKKILDSDSETDSSSLPVGLQDWNTFGAPNGCPGRSSWHPKKAEHELLGHLLAMHFTKAIERAVELSKGQSSSLLDYYQPHHRHKEENIVFPPPFVTSNSENPKAVQELLFGHESSEHNDVFQLQPLSCRTSFLPAQDHDKVLPSVIVNGLADNIPDDPMQARSDEVYQEGWVLDVSKIERDTKKKVEKCGGLGYIDMKVALYGIPESGPLRLWLPYEGTMDSTTDESALHWFNGIIMLCEANEKRDDAACQLDRDLQITVGGVKATDVTMVDTVGVYLNRKTCLAVPIPQAAKVTTIQHVITSAGDALSESEQQRLAPGANVGLVVDLKAGPKVTRSAGACCVSHIVWEHN